MSLTSQEITRHSLTYKSFLRGAGVVMDDHANRLLNGLSDYLANLAAIRDLPEPGTPLGSELMADDKETRVSVEANAGH